MPTNCSANLNHPHLDVGTWAPILPTQWYNIFPSDGQCIANKSRGERRSLRGYRVPDRQSPSRMEAIRQRTGRSIPGNGQPKKGERRPFSRVTREALPDAILITRRLVIAVSAEIRRLLIDRPPGRDSRACSWVWERWSARRWPRQCIKPFRHHGKEARMSRLRVDSSKGSRDGLCSRGSSLPGAAMGNVITRECARRSRSPSMPCCHRRSNGGRSPGPTHTARIGEIYAEISDFAKFSRKIPCGSCESHGL